MIFLGFILVINLYIGFMGLLVRVSTTRNGEL
jgi:hypothetical protein